MAKRFIIEFGTGIDLHGMDYTKAAEKAIKNATSNSTLIGLQEVVNYDSKTHELSLKIKIAAPEPEKVKTEILRESVVSFFENVTFEVVKGGMTEEGIDHAGNKETIVVVNCSITVYVKEK